MSLVDVAEQGLLQVTGVLPEHRPTSSGFWKIKPKTTFSVPLLALFSVESAIEPVFQYPRRIVGVCNSMSFIPPSLFLRKAFSILAGSWGSATDVLPGFVPLPASLSVSSPDRGGLQPANGGWGTRRYIAFQYPHRIVGGCNALRRDGRVSEPGFQHPRRIVGGCNSRFWSTTRSQSDTLSASSPDRGGLQPRAANPVQEGLPNFQHPRRIVGGCNYEGGKHLGLVTVLSASSPDRGGLQRVLTTLIVLGLFAPFSILAGSWGAATGHGGFGDRGRASAFSILAGSWGAATATRRCDSGK